MKYNELIKILKEKKYNKILITGPQRSGTRFTTNTIGNDLGNEVIDELDYGINDINKFLNLIKHKNSFTAQGPAISHQLNHLPKDVIIIFMIRPINEILNSQKRINWHSNTHEPTYKNLYKKEYPKHKTDWGKSLCEVKYDIWENIQKGELENLFFDLDYNSLSSHEMWKPKNKRINFKANQIK